MKKILIICLAVCLTLSFSAAAMAEAQPDQKAAVMLEGFDDLTDDDIGWINGSVSNLDPHEEWGFGTGTMKLIKTAVSRQGLALLPDYVSGYNEGVMRAAYYRLGTKNVSTARAEAVSEAWKNADGFRFYIKNNTDSDVYFSTALFFTDPAAPSDDNTTCFSLYTGTKLFKMNGEEEKAEFIEEGWKNHQVMIPWGFEGWVDIPLTLAGVGGNDREGDYGWDLIQWEEEASGTDKLANSYIAFENIYYMQLDFRLSTPKEVLEYGDPEDFNIILDSIQLYQEEAGEITYLPDDRTPDLPPEENTPEPSEQVTPSVTADNSTQADPTASANNGVQTAASSSVEEPGTEKADFPWLIVAAAAAVVIIAAVVIGIAMAKKKKKD